MGSVPGATVGYMDPIQQSKYYIKLNHGVNISITCLTIYRSYRSLQVINILILCNLL